MCLHSSGVDRTGIWHCYSLFCLWVLQVSVSEDDLVGGFGLAWVTVVDLPLGGGTRRW